MLRGRDCAGLFDRTCIINDYQFLGEEIVVNADCMNQESSPPYRVQIRIAPVHPRIGVVDGGTPTSGSHTRLAVLQVSKLYHKRLTTIPDTWIFHLHMRSSGGVGRVAFQDGQSLLK